MADNVELHLERNALLQFSPDKTLFVDPKGKAKRCLPGIRAVRRRNIAITGEGTIDGNGAHWRPVKRGKVSDVEWNRFKKQGGVERQDGKLWYPWDATEGASHIADTPEGEEAKREDLIRLTDCENVKIEGVTVQNAPRFHVHPVSCRNVIIQSVTVRCPWNAQNGDAIDLSDCHQALVEGCTVDAGDDGICLKSGNPRRNAVAHGCEDILVQDNTVYHAHGGFVVGSEFVGGLRRVVARRCLFSGTEAGLRFKSGVGRGGKSEDVYIENIVMNDITGAAITFQCDYVDRPAGRTPNGLASDAPLENVPLFTDIHITGVTCRGAQTAIYAHGLDGLDCIKGIDVSRSTIVYRQKGLDIDKQTADLRLTDVTVEQGR